jgi:hypothetical protein
VGQRGGGKNWGRNEHLVVRQSSQTW